MRWALAVLLCSTLLPSCYRTHYANFSPANPNRAPQQTEPVKQDGGWQHFFLFGWLPVERVIDAREKCGGADNVDSIQTRQTFFEGLVRMLTSFYINIYAPWDGAVYCKVDPKTLPQPPAPTQPQSTP